MTARETALANRLGYTSGCWQNGPGTRSECDQKAAKQFPLPKIIKQRIVKLHGFEYRVTDGVVEWANIGMGDWGELGDETTIIANLPKLQVVVDLLQHPTEEVDDE